MKEDTFYTKKFWELFFSSIFFTVSIPIIFGLLFMYYGMAFNNNVFYVMFGVAMILGISLISGVIYLIFCILILGLMIKNKNWIWVILWFFLAPIVSWAYYWSKVRETAKY